MNFNVNWVFPHPEGPLTMELNGCLQDGSILQNEEDTGLNVILILSFIQFMYSQQNVHCIYIHIRISFVSQQNIYKMSIKFIYNHHSRIYMTEKYLQFIRVFSFQGNFIGLVTV